MKQTELAAKLRAIADGGHRRAPDLREMASRCDATAVGFYGFPTATTTEEFLVTHDEAQALLLECEPRRMERGRIDDFGAPASLGG